MLLSNIEAAEVLAPPCDWQVKETVFLELRDGEVISVVLASDTLGSVAHCLNSDLDVANLIEQKIDPDQPCGFYMLTGCLIRNAEDDRRLSSDLTPKVAIEFDGIRLATLNETLEYA